MLQQTDSLTWFTLKKIYSITLELVQKHLNEVFFDNPRRILIY